MYSFHFLSLSPVAFFFPDYKLPGGAVAESVKHATPSKEIVGSIPAVAARFLLVGSVSV